MRAGNTYVPTRLDLRSAEMLPDPCLGLIIVQEIIVPIWILFSPLNSHKTKRSERGKISSAPVSLDGYLHSLCPKDIRTVLTFSSPRLPLIPSSKTFRSLSVCQISLLSVIALRPASFPLGMPMSPVEESFGRRR
jgi:hypothetical protein